MPKIVSIHSYRGGTGKSNLTANIATAIALQGNRVAVVDTDLQSPGIHAIFSVDEKITGKTLNDYLWGRSPIVETAFDVGSNLGIQDRGSLFLVPASMNPDEIARILSEGYNVSLLNDGFRKLIKELNLDFLLIDTHPGLSRETLLSIAISNLLVMILRPDRQDYQGTAVTADVARQLSAPSIKLVINKVPSKISPEILRQKVEQTYDLPVAGIFPLSEEMAQFGSTGLFCIQYPEDPFTQELMKVANQILS